MQYTIFFIQIRLQTTEVPPAVGQAIKEMLKPSSDDSTNEQKYADILNVAYNDVKPSGMVGKFVASYTKPNNSEFMPFYDSLTEAKFLEVLADGYNQTYHLPK